MKPKPSSSIERAIRSGGCSKREAERLEHVGGAGGRRHGPVPVLGNARAGRRRHDRGRRRDVERVRAVAARPGRVDEVVPLRPHRQDVLAHRLRATGDLVRRLALDAERDEEAADLGRRRLAAHDLVHDLTRALTREVASLEQLCERGLDHG